MAYSKQYIPGDRLVDCEICGFTYRFSEMRRGVSGKQKGLVTCPLCFDPPHPRDTVKPRHRIEGRLKEVR